MGGFFFLSVVLLVVGFNEHRKWCSPKGGSITTLVKIPCNKVNKGKIITKVMGHLFQSECWEKHPSGCSFHLLWLRKIAKAMEKALERHEALIGILFMKIMEIRIKVRRKVTGCM